MKKYLIDIDELKHKSFRETCELIKGGHEKEAIKYAKSMDLAVQLIELFGEEIKDGR